tara:strand:+ start:737 stop:1051 length:315 start_codon:yes stop_codon:yes gene_type:complete
MSRAPPPIYIGAVALELFIVNYKYSVGDLVELTRFLDSAVALVVRRNMEYASSAYDVLKHVRGSDIVVNKLVSDLLSYDIYLNTGSLITVKEKDILKKVGENDI